MNHYEEETRALNAVLLSLFSTRHEQAFRELEKALQTLAYPPAVLRLCEQALQNRSACASQEAHATAVSCLLDALEGISGYKHVERYIAQRNRATVCGI